MVGYNILLHPKHKSIPRYCSITHCIFDHYMSRTRSFSLMQIIMHKIEILKCKMRIKLCFQSNFKNQMKQNFLFTMNIVTNSSIISILSFFSFSNVHCVCAMQRSITMPTFNLLKYNEWIIKHR